MHNRNLLIGLYPKVIHRNTVREITGYCVYIIYSSFKEYRVMASCHMNSFPLRMVVYACFPKVFFQNVPSYMVLSLANYWKNFLLKDMLFLPSRICIALGHMLLLLTANIYIRYSHFVNPSLQNSVHCKKQSHYRPGGAQSVPGS